MWIKSTDDSLISRSLQIFNMLSQPVIQNFKVLTFLFVNAWSRDTSINCYFSIKIFMFIESNSFQFEGTHLKAVAQGNVCNANEVWVDCIRSVSLGLLISFVFKISFLNITFLSPIYVWPYLDSVWELFPLPQLQVWSQNVEIKQEPKENQQRDLKKSL